MPVGRKGYPAVKWATPSADAKDLYFRLKPYAKLYSPNRHAQDCMSIIERFLVERDRRRRQTMQKGTCEASRERP